MSKTMNNYRINQDRELIHRLDAIIKNHNLLNMIIIYTINHKYLHMNINGRVIQIHTDYKTFCYCITTDNITMSQVTKFNCDILVEPEITEESIILVLYNVFNEKKISFVDTYHLYDTINDNLKYVVDFTKITCNKKHSIITNRFHPDYTNRLLTDVQIKKLIKTEILNINKNNDYKHYIYPDNNDLFTLNICLFLSPESIMGKHLGEKYITLTVKLDTIGYPFIAPTIEYKGCKAHFLFILSINNLDILKQANWSPIISLEYLFTNLVSQINELKTNYFLVDENIDDFDYQILKLSKFSNSILAEKIPFKFDIHKYKTQCKTANYWVSGTGYGTQQNNNWNIDLYIKEQRVLSEEHGVVLQNIYNILKDDFKVSQKQIELVKNHILMQINNINLFEFQKNTMVYNYMFCCLELLIKYFDQQDINTIVERTRNLKEEFEYIKTNSPNDSDDSKIYNRTEEIIQKYIDKYIKPIDEIVINEDIKEQYCIVHKKLQFGHYDLEPSHLYYSHKDTKIESKSTMRILSEISSLKQNLPLNWGSTIWVRVSKSNLNLLKLLISGPKDTPYENGLFEFHIHFPNNYPLSPPNVLLKTTGNSTVRFNPNLYDNGKVCLSLLGTWSGQSGESWSPATSSLLQVIVSIQSLIFVDDPYFNEPGYEKYMKHPEYIKKSKTYNEEKQRHTINLAMIQMIKEPIKGFEDVIKEHFKSKKEEIVNKTLIWEQSATNATYKENIKYYRDELITLLN